MTQVHFDIQTTETHISMNNQTEEKENVVIEILDYGDNYFDVHFLNLKTDSIFGESYLAVIVGMERTKEIVSELIARSGLSSRIVKVS